MTEHEVKELRTKAKQLNKIRMLKEREAEVLKNILAFEAGEQQRSKRTRNIIISLLVFSSIVLLLIFPTHGVSILQLIEQRLASSAPDEIIQEKELHENILEPPTPDIIDTLPIEEQTEEGRRVALSFLPMMPDILEHSTIPETHTFIRTVEIAEYQQFNRLNFGIYEDVDGVFHVYMQDTHKTYYLGDYGSSSIMNSESISIQLRERAEDIGQYIELSGGGGAIVENKQLVIYDLTQAKWQRWNMSNTTEEILELDGTSYYVATSRGSLPSYVSIIRWHGTGFEYADVADELDMVYANLKHALDRVWIEVGSWGDIDEPAVTKHYFYEKGYLIQLNRSQEKALEIYDSLNIHATKDEILSQYGSKYSVRIGHMQNDQYWEYLFGVREGYVPLDLDDTIDLEGLLNDDIVLAFNVAWDDLGESITRLSITYKESDDTLISYLMIDDGFTKYDVLNFH